MTRDKINIALASILTTLAEVNDSAPEGILYAGLNAQGYSLGDFDMLRMLLIQGQLCTREAGPCLALTDQGRKLAAQINAAIA